jgi:hypothetical protein
MTVIKEHQELKGCNDAFPTNPGDREYYQDQVLLALKIESAI